MKNIIAMSVMMVTAAALSQPVTAESDPWQEKLLFDPGPAQLEMERSRHRVMIYHGLKDVQVEQAMNTQFDRLEHMMFTGTVLTDDRGEVLRDPETGELRVEDDGC